MIKWWRERRSFGNQRGFTLVELMVVVGIIGILAAIAVPIYAGMQAQARSSKIQADLRSLSSATTGYAAHCGAIPATGYATAAAANCGAAGGPLNLLQAHLVGGITAGPFMGGTALPTPPAGCGGAYTYTVPAPGMGAGTFQYAYAVGAIPGCIAFAAP